MKKIKIIDLLHLVYEGKAPKKILYKYCEYEFSSFFEDYVNKDGLRLFSYLFQNEERALYFEVEILEDKPKKMKKIELDLAKNIITDDGISQHRITTNTKDRDIYIPKINWLIDEVNYLLEKSGKDE